MILELSLMTVSVAVMVFLIVHRHLEVKNGIKTVVFAAREKADPVLRDFHQRTGVVLSGITMNNVLLLVNKIFVFVVRFFMEISHRVHVISSTIVEKASIKKENLSRSGSASFFLKQIKESKENNKTIEEKPTETGEKEEKM